jgi:hypothetical protein
VSHRASLDVSAPVLRAVTSWIARRRRRPGSRPAQRAGTVHTQVVLVLRWLRHRLDLRTLAGDAGLSIATTYRYLHETLDVIAAHAPDLHDVVRMVSAADQPFLCLDGTLVRTDRVAARAERGHHRWSSGKHHAFGGTVQVLCDPGGFPLRVPLPDVVAMQTRQPNLEGAGEIPLRRLVKEALRMRPSRIVVGEARQEECLDLTQYSSTHTGREHFPSMRRGAKESAEPWQAPPV